MNLFVLRLIGQKMPLSFVCSMVLGLAVALTGGMFGGMTGTSVEAQAQPAHFSGKIRRLPKYRTATKKISHKRRGYRRHHNVRRGRIHHRSTNYKHYLPGSRKSYRHHYNPRRHINRRYNNYKYYGPPGRTHHRAHRRYHRRYNYLNGRHFYYKHPDSYYRSNHRDYHSYYRGHSKVIKRRIIRGVRPDVLDGPVRAEVVNKYQSKPTTIFFDEKKCTEGQDCVMRLGLSPSSPKIIVLGDNRQSKSSTDKKPKIIYPPIN